MGRNKRVGRDRDNGPDPLARLAAPAASTQPWGVTGMPSWLDTPAGRAAWAADRSDERPAEPVDRSGGRPETPRGNDDPDWRPPRPAPDPDWLDRRWDDERGDDGRGDVGRGDDGRGDVDDGHRELPDDPLDGDPMDRQSIDDYPMDDVDEAADADDDPPGLESLGDGDDWEDDWEPPRRRLTMLPPAAIGLIVVGIIACAIAGYSLLKQNEPTAPLVAFDAAADSAVPPAEPSAAVPPTPAPTDGQIIVSVVGLVHKPGLVRIAATARVADAIDRAGGARPGADLVSLNMAQLLHDGDQILVGQGDGGTVKSAVVAAAGAPGPEPSGNGGSLPANGTGLVDLNTATVELLDTLPGVGPVTAEAIIAWRQANGKFSSVEQLAEVDGIGPARLAKLKSLVTVG